MHLYHNVNRYKTETNLQETGKKTLSFSHKLYTDGLHKGFYQSVCVFSCLSRFYKRISILSTAKMYNFILSLSDNNQADIIDIFDFYVIKTRLSIP